MSEEGPRGQWKEKKAQISLVHSTVANLSSDRGRENGERREGGKEGWKEGGRRQESRGERWRERVYFRILASFSFNYSFNIYRGVCGILRKPRAYALLRKHTIIIHSCIHKHIHTQTCIVRAWDQSKPLLYAPAMNTAMWTHPLTSAHISVLSQLGYTQVSVHATFFALFLYGTLLSFPPPLSLSSPSLPGIDTSYL